MTHSPDSTHEEIVRWLETMVIGLNLCPFARGPHEQGRVHVAVADDATTFEHAMERVLDEMDALLELDAETRSTTLVVIPHALLDFDDFLEAIACVENLLLRSGADALLQLAHFHPNYLFEDVPAHDPSHYTNRSPHPILHLLRAEEVADAIHSMDGIAHIPARNIRLLREMGLDALSALQHHITHP